MKLEHINKLANLSKTKTFKLTQHGELKFKGSENECYYKLQRLQGQSANWAMKYEGWKVTEINN